MRIVTAVEMRRLEQLTAEGGFSFGSMMERAGHAIAQAVVKRLIPSDGRIVVLVGTGNNGGDGLVAARYLRLAGYDVACYAIKHRASDDLNVTKLIGIGVPLVSAEDDLGWLRLSSLLCDCSAVVDALLGTGAKGPLRGLVSDLLDQLNKYLLEQKHKPYSQPLLRDGQSANRKPFVIAVDLPSGLDADTGVIDEHTLKADLTVTFGYPKYGHMLSPGSGYVGELLVVDIGLVNPAYDPYEPQMATPEMVTEWLPRRPALSHKGTYGGALVVGGSAQYVGAPRLAAEAAYRVGAGLVTLALPAAIYSLVAVQLPEATYLVLSDDLGALTPQATRVLFSHLGKYTALLVGPGLGNEPETAAFITAFFGNSQKALGFRPDENRANAKPSLPPTVIDADGLNLLASITNWWERLPENCILTPHPGEMARLCQCDIKQVQANRFAIAKEKALSWKCTVVLKGAGTVVASPEGQVTIIPFANPLLAVAGTGDVLAGAIVGLLAQEMPAYQAAVCGAYLHGMAGEIKRREIGEAGLLAHELIPLLASAAKLLRE